jgi:class 3 adenylate cyclase
VPSRLEKKSRGFKTRIIVLYADIRDFSSWSTSAQPNHVAKLVEICYERVHQLHLDYHHNFHRLLGDGFLLVWKTAEFAHYDASKCHDSAGALSEAIGAALEIHKKYFYLRRHLSFPTPMGFGISITLGVGYRVRLRTNLSNLSEDDYVGPSMNTGARLQKVAGPYEIVLDPSAAKVCQACSRELLRTDMPGLELEVVKPPQSALAKAASLKGLRRRDRLGCRYLRRENWVWNSSDLPRF